jgi:hypothetical protein
MTEPLTPPDCDLQDFAFMPLHVARLRDSDLAAEEDPEACWYAVLLWAASWHQLPAGSLPDNDAVLARLCGLGRDVRTFKKHRTGALRGFIVCNDGRLYHPVVAEQVLSAWAEKNAYRERKAKRVEIAKKAAEARWGTDDADADHMHDAMHEASPKDASSIDHAMPKGTGTGTGIYSEPDGSADPGKTLFDEGIRLLVSKGRQESSARSILAKFQRDYGDGPTLDALNKARNATDPVSAMRDRLGKAKSQQEYYGV